MSAVTPVPSSSPPAAPPRARWPAPAESLRDAQAAIARLYTDAGALAAFRRDPAGFTARHGPEAARLLQGVDVGGLARFARSLMAKRGREAGRMLPLTARALDQRYPALFRAHAARVAPAGCRKPLADALAFAGRLARDRQASREVREAARFERLSLLVHFRLDTRAAVDGGVGGRSAAICEATPRGGVWLRPGLFRYAFPAIESRAPDPAAWPRRPTVVLFARVFRWSGVWYW